MLGERGRAKDACRQQCPLNSEVLACWEGSDPQEAAGAGLAVPGQKGYGYVSLLPGRCLDASAIALR
jgi:hypothetical protein